MADIRNAHPGMQDLIECEKSQKLLAKLILKMLQLLSTPVENILIQIVASVNPSLVFTLVCVCVVEVRFSLYKSYPSRSDYSARVVG